MSRIAEWSFGLGVPGGIAVAALVTGALLAVLVLGLWDLRREPRRSRRLVLGALRVATALAAVAIALQPQWTGERVRREEGALAVLADVSRSMSVEAGDRARSEVAKSRVGQWRRQDGADRTMTFAFGGDARPSSLERLAETYPATDGETRIGDAIAKLIRREAGGTLGAVVVLSDGAESGQLRVDDIARTGVRVHTVSVGDDTELRDDAVARLEADPIGFLRQPAEVHVVVRSLGGNQDRIPVRLRKGNQVVREETVQLGDNGEGSVDIEFTPQELGRSIYRVTIPVAPDDAVPENNERVFLVRVNRDKLRVLLVAGRPSWDVRFLRAFLKRDPSIDLVSFFILRTGADLTMAPPDELALIPFPTEELFREHLGSFDVVFFQNFEYGPYGMARYLPRIRDYVQRGGAFAMIGGAQSFASGGYTETPLAEILPVEMPPSSTPETQALLTGRFHPQRVPELVQHPLLALLPDASASASLWGELAPLQGANVLHGTRRDAQSLLVHPDQQTAAGNPMPVLVVGEAGDGRVLALGTDSSWRWGMTTAGRRGDASAYERFWDRALRWLARDPALEPCRITTDRERYGPSERVQIEGQVRNARYQPLANQELRLAIVDSEGEPHASSNVRTDGQGRVRAELESPGAPGGYRATVRRPDETEPRCDTGFVVEHGGEELADPRPRPELLHELADATDGSFYDDPQDAPPLGELDATRTRSLGIVKVAPLSSPWAFVLVIVLFCAEWVLRRRWGHR